MVDNDHILIDRKTYDLYRKGYNNGYHEGYSARYLANVKLFVWVAVCMTFGKIVLALMK